MKIVVPCLACRQEMSIDGNAASCVNCLRARNHELEQKLEIVVRALADPVSFDLGHLDAARQIVREVLTGARR